MKSAFGTLLVVACCGVSFFCYAEPDKGMNFYDKGYANSPQIQLNGAQGGSVGTATRDNPTRDNTVLSAPGGQGSTSPVRDVGTDLNSTPVKGIDVYVNSLNKPHFLEVLSSVISMTKSERARVSRVYQIGDYRNISDDDKAQLDKLEVQVRAQVTLPPDLEVTESPVWVLYTPSGRYVIEGSTNIDRFLGTHGEFIIPVRGTPTPGSKMSGF